MAEKKKKVAPKGKKRLTSEEKNAAPKGKKRLTSEEKNAASGYQPVSDTNPKE